MKTQKYTDIKRMKKFIVIIAMLVIPMILIIMPRNVSAQGGTGLNIEVSPLSYDFGSVEIGTSDSTTITISNIGLSDLVISDLSLGLGSCDDFHVFPLGTLIEDQSCEFPTGTFYGFLPGEEGSFFQSFVANTTSLKAVDLLLREGPDFPAEGYSTTIYIREVNPLGPVLGTATTFIPGPGVAGSQLTVQFLFFDSIPLNPGQTYYIEWISPPEGGMFYLSWMGGDIDPNPYAFGHAYKYTLGTGLQEFPTLDLIFTTYSSASSGIIVPGSFIEVDIVYTPSHLGSCSGVLEVLSNDPIEPFIEVQLSGRSEIVSNWLVNEVTLDGIVDPLEWNDAIPYNVSLFREWGWPSPQYAATDKVLTIHFKNDEEWLYLLYEILWEGPESPPEAGGMSYHDFSGSPTTSSDSAWANLWGGISDYYGWDLSSWLNDDQIDVEGTGNYDGNYYRFEFRKRLDSGDGQDWILSPGDLIGNPDSPYDPPYLYVQLWDVETQSVYQQNIAIELSTGPVSWWPGDSNPFDIAGVNHGEMNFDTSFIPGKVDEAFYFDGVEDLVFIPSPTGVNDLQQLTIEGWVKHDSLPQLQIQRYITLTGEKAVLRYDGVNGLNQLHFYMKNGNDLYDIRVDDVLQIDTFHHVGGTYDGNFMRLYLDGEEIGELEVGGIFQLGEGIELSSDWESFHGILDEFAIYDRALNPSEIQAIYNAGEQGKYKPDKELYLPNPVPITTDIELTHDLKCQSDGFLIKSSDIFVDGFGHRITGSDIGRGIVIDDQFGLRIEIRNLLIQNFETGIFVLGDPNPGLHSIIGNYISDNNIGISLSSAGSEVANNIIARNQLGLSITYNPNYIYRNLIINNVEQIQENGGNIWDWEDQVIHIGNLWSNYWGDDLDGDYIGDTDLPHEGVDYYPLLDPSIPEKYGPLPYADWWMGGRGGSPVMIQAINPYGQILSADLNEIGLNGFYMEKEDGIQGEDNIMIIIAINPDAPILGTYTLEITTTEETTYSLLWFVSGLGKILFERVIENVPIDVGQSDKISTDIEEVVDPVPGDHPIIVEPGDVIRQDDGAPIVDVYQPGSSEHIIGSNVDVVGIATDDLGVDNITVNGEEVDLISTNNPNDPNEVSFSTTVHDLETGENLIIIVATDIVGNSITMTRTIFRDDSNPEITLIEGPSDPLSLGTICEMIGIFTDLDIGDTHTALWDWGDGTSPTVGTVDQLTDTVTGFYEYNAPGVYLVTLSVEDSIGEVGTAIWSQYIVIYDPSGGFVTGGGWIDSPEGAYPTDPSLTGKASFGFVAKYKKGSREPTGNTDFMFRAGDLNFHSDSYQWLTIAGARAMFKGNGTINGEDSYKFILTAIDGDLISVGSPDKFRIKIWFEDGSGEEIIVYDNQMSTEDGEEWGGTTIIGGGSIKIHN